jgi:malto-oligosyltrehalose synthase/4-alpha-glucanotransferase
MHNPIATYRLQFHKDFKFDDLERILPYLQKLGVSTIYASPIFEAVPGSTHGYDNVDPNRINPEIGTEEQLKLISQALKESGIKWIQDIVPNHMGFHPNNWWLMDVLEKGQNSFYAKFFDIGWENPLYNGRLMVPFLGSPLEDVIRNGELSIVYHDGRLLLKYYDSQFPLNAASYQQVFGQKVPDAQLSRLLTELPASNDTDNEKSFSHHFKHFRSRLEGLVKDEKIRTFLNQSMEKVNKDHEILQRIAETQHYRLCHWQETDHQINYRRFFTVNGLICLNVQDSEVFSHHHLLALSLLNEGIFQGLRIDHIDGLYDPTHYLEQLREAAGENSFIVVEKILEPNEGLPSNWPIQGNTGYDFLAMVNNVFTNMASKKPLTQFYQQLVKDRTSLHLQLRKKKSHILYRNMGGELNNLFNLFTELKLVEKKSLATIHSDDLKTALAEFLIECPVYRYYGNSFPLDNEEASALHGLFNRIRKSGGVNARVVSILEKLFLEKPLEGDEVFNEKLRHFYQRCMQFTGPLMAKGMEDTLMYTYNRFIGRNEVGDSPEVFGFSTSDFHSKMKLRQEQWPYSINTMATHDTKRGEDVRARLNVITDIPGEWIAKVGEWQLLNASLKKDGAPDANDEYLIYQSLLGSWPMPGEDEDRFADRFQDFIQKALREAKLHSNWTTPDEAYESASKEFAVALLDKQQPFWKSFEAFHRSIADHGIVNSLSQVLLKFTCPGIPDVYQGGELWDLSFVDPDNRRPVDYEKRTALLEAIEGTDEHTLLPSLWNNRYNGHVKLWLVHRLMNLRKKFPEVFSEGDYIPLNVEGAFKDHVLAFARKHRRTMYVVALPLRTAALCNNQQKDIKDIDWKDTRIILTEEANEEWESLLLETKGNAEKGLRVSDLFSHVPVALVRVQQPVNERSAGILMHISSLPAPFGIGDLGPQAYAFADFLYRSRQKSWQLLPINSTEGGQGHSPYSATSSRAGNPLFISPELLVKEGFLDQQEIESMQLEPSGKVDFEGAERIKKSFFEKAYSNFTSNNSRLSQEFESFCREQASWLDDFAFYVLLKQQHDGKPWYEWPEEFKNRDEKALNDLKSAHAAAYDRARWLQFIFFRQWHDLKNYCNARSLQLIGDLPFYVSYDSSDVWAHKELFALDESGNRTGMAGVPPDAFSSDGQLWGMPIFRWDVLKERNYDWWVDRLRRNTELFDLVRLDHFRAFADYWEVPAGETTAKNGTWQTGPGSDFFQVVSQELGGLPFVAEDLGEINDDVLRLRDDFKLPGMKILQFAFGDNMPRSEHAPHNYTTNFIAYTGTHDNNTIRGWYNQDADENTRLRMEAYVGRALSAAEVNHVLGRMAFASVARVVILPVQDVLGLDESARMNMPGSGNNNWSWRLYPEQLNSASEELLRKWTLLYNRD